MGEQHQSGLESYKKGFRQLIKPFFDVDRYVDYWDLPHFSQKDIDEFIQTDPVHGPQMKKVKQASSASLIGAGTVATAAALYYSRNYKCAIVGGILGLHVGWFLGKEVANYGLGMYKFDPNETNVRFLKWWERKCEEKVAALSK